MSAAAVGPNSFEKTCLQLFEDIEIVSRIVSVVRRTIKAAVEMHDAGILILNHPNVVRFTETITKLSHASDVFLLIRLIQNSNKFIVKSKEFLNSDDQEITHIKSFIHFLRFLKVFSLATKAAFIFQRMKIFQMSSNAQKVCFSSYPIIKVVISLSDIVAALDMLKKNIEELEKAEQPAKSCSTRIGPEGKEVLITQKFIATLRLIKVISSFVAGVFATLALIAGLPQVALNVALIGIAIDLTSYFNHLASIFYRAVVIHNPNVQNQN